MFRTITTYHTVNRIIHTAETLSLFLRGNKLMVNRVENAKKSLYGYFRSLNLGELPEEERNQYAWRAYGFAPQGSTIYMTTCGLPVFMDWKMNELDPVFDIPEVQFATLVARYGSITESKYFFVLVSALNNKIRLCLFKLTPPFPKDKSVHLYRTLISRSENILVAHEGFLFFSFYRPPPE